MRSSLSADTIGSVREPRRASGGLLLSCTRYADAQSWRAHQHLSVSFVVSSILLGGTFLIW
jgi:hypothetical protein